MNCSEARAAWQAQCDCELAPGEARRLEAHLERCPACARFAREMEAVLGGLAALRTESESLSARRAARRPSRLWRIAAVASAAAAVLVAALGWRPMRPAPPAGPPVTARPDAPAERAVAAVVVELGGESAERYIALPAATRQAKVHVVRLYPVVSADDAADSKPQSGAARERTAGAGASHGYAMLWVLSAVR